ncbi:MAG: hypothetical protein WA708_18085 [Acidobacteriaceae bacterium]
MNAEQLNSARLARWSQNGDARLTLEVAAEWLNSIGFCPYLPTPAGTAPSPSFLEAVVGRPAQIPSMGERSRANDLLVRVVESSAAVPLKLGSSLGEQPDCIASPETLRYIYALCGSRNFKTGPSTVGNEKVTPLALHCWQAIREQGPLDVAALQPILGRDMTEAAILRALHELWSGMYIFPLLRANSQPAQWEMLPRQFPQQVGAGAATGQAEAQSAMVSLYLHAVVAAPEEEVLAALSPFAPQSKLREVIRGLGSMRQLDILDIGGRAHVCLQGGLLPEMVMHLSEESLTAPSVAPGGTREMDDEIVAKESVGALTASSEIAIERESRRGFQFSTGNVSEQAGKFAPKKFGPKKFVAKQSQAGKLAGKRFGFGSAARDASAFPRRNFRGDGSNAGGRSFTPRSPREDSGERGRPWEKPERRAGFKPGGFKSAGFQHPRPWKSKDPAAKTEGAKSWTKRADANPGARQDSGNRQGNPPRRWDKPREGAARSESETGKRYAAKPPGFRSSGFKLAGAKPWAAKSGERFPRRFERSGPKPGDREIARQAGGRSAEPRNFSKRDGKSQSGAEGTKPWKKRTDSRGAGFDKGAPTGKPPRREKSQGAPATSKPGGKRDAKPFWAKNPRGGKGSAAGSRSNRPRVKSGGKKKGGKKK